MPQPRIPRDEYDIDARDAADIALFGALPSVNFGFFNRLVDEAVIHAADTARADGNSANLPWVSLGPRNVGGRIRALVQDPINPRTFFAGSAFGGLWKTENGGDTWKPLDVFFENAVDALHANAAGLPIGAIGICHRDPQVIYVGTGEAKKSSFSGAGLYRSTDGGASFNRIAPLSGFNNIPAIRYERIRVDPWNSGRCWMATPVGLYRRDPAAVGGPYIRDEIDVPNAPSQQDVTDVTIDFGTRTDAVAPGNFIVYAGVRSQRETTNPADANFGEVFGGVFRAEFDPVNNQYVRSIPGDPASPFWVRMAGDDDWPFPVIDDDQDYDEPAGDKRTDADGSLGNIGRVKIGLCERHPENVYFVVGLSDHSASRVFRSTDSGRTWTRTANRSLDSGRQAWYDLLVEVHPDDPSILFTGSVELFRSTDSGDSWERVIHWPLYRTGDRAQHADQHDLIFDRRDPRRIWLCNDGGISESGNLGADWRKRSHGIQASMFFDLTTHQTYPFIMGGGLQDNGSWVSFGGTNWIQAGTADGASIGFQPNVTDAFLVTNQGSILRSQVQFNEFATLNAKELGNDTVFRDWLFRNRFRLPNKLADRPTRTDTQGRTLYPYTIVEGINRTDGISGSQLGEIFGRELEAHPTRPDNIIHGGAGAVHIADEGSISAVSASIEFSQTDTGDFTPEDAEVTAIAYAPTLPSVPTPPVSDTHWWFGTDGGEVFFTNNGGTDWVNVTGQLPGAPSTIAGIAIHPADPQVVVISTAGSGRVYISNDAMAMAGSTPSSTWRRLSDFAPARPADDLPVSPITRVVFGPNEDGGPASLADATQPQTLYVSTIAGIYVCRNAMADGTGAPVWRTLNNNMPLVMVRDLEYREAYAADGTTPTRRFLRAGTFGRGIYELDLGGAPRAKYLLRNTIIDDSHSYAPAQTITYDPRLSRPGQPQTPLDFTRSVDIRVDSAPFSFFEAEIDGVEFDEDLRSSDLVAGDRNNIYVQVHNRGWEEQNGVDVHLYFADAPGTPPVVPDLDAGFWGAFPGAAPGPVWRKAGTAAVDEVNSAQPRVARLEWIPPTDMGDNVALLAVVTGPQDALVTAGLPLVVEPNPATPTLTFAERRASLLVTPSRKVTPDIYVRDGIADTGEPGAVAWGGRTADIVVVQAPEPDPDVTFASIADERPGDRIQAGVTNHIYVRAFNRALVAQSAEVDLYFVPYATLADPATWVRIGARTPVAAIPPGGQLFTAAFDWAAGDIPDPAPASDIKAHILVALIGSADDPVPDHTAINSLGAFWDFFLSANNANNASFRAIEYLPAP